MKHLQLTIGIAEAGRKDLEIREAIEGELPLFHTYTNVWESIDLDDTEENNKSLDWLGSDIYDALTAVGVTDFSTKIIESEE